MSNSEKHKQKRKKRNKQKRKENIINRAIQKGADLIAKPVTRKMQHTSFDESAEIVLSTANKLKTPANILRTQIIKAAEKEMYSCIKQGKTDEEILQPAFDSPNYQKLLKYCEMNNEHLKVILKEQREKFNGND